MSKKVKIGIVALLVVSALAVVVVGSALAQGPTPPGPFGKHLFGWVRGGFGPAGADGWTMFDTAAEALGLTPEELFAELHAGKNLDEIAEAQGVDTQTVYDALKAARVEAVQQAVEDGRLTQEQADRMIEKLESMPSSPEEALEARKQAIQQAVEEGRMSQEQADWLLQGLDNGYWGGRGYGSFDRFGGFRGMHWGHGPRGAGR